MELTRAVVPGEILEMAARHLVYQMERKDEETIIVGERGPEIMVTGPFWVKNGDVLGPEYGPERPPPLPRSIPAKRKGQRRA